MNEDKATRYHRQARIVRVATAALGAAFLVLLLVSGASLVLRLASQAVAGSVAMPSLVPFLTVALYAAALAAANDVLALPLSYFRGFVLERRYDLSRQTATAWLHDHLKASLLGLIFAVLACELVYACLRAWPERWWWAAGFCLVIVTLALTRLAPVLLLPVFYRFAPLSRASLRDRLGALARRAGTPVVGVFEWKLGEKSSRANAALAGLGATRRILVSDTLLRDYSDDEIEVVLAHELSHHVHRDLWMAVALEAVVIFVALAAGHYALTALGPRLGLSGIDDVAGLPVLILAGGAVSLVLLPLANAISRHHEYRADRYALDLTGNAPAFLSAMRKLGAQNLAEASPSRLVEILFHTHPPIARRLAVARMWREERRGVQRDVAPAVRE
jgi:STE24 endopeptidase